MPRIFELLSDEFVEFFISNHCSMSEYIESEWKNGTGRKLFVCREAIENHVDSGKDTATEENIFSAFTYNSGI